jgi:hypothetical protein
MEYLSYEEFISTSNINTNVKGNGNMDFDSELHIKDN